MTLTHVIGTVAAVVALVGPATVGAAQQPSHPMAGAQAASLAALAECVALQQQALRTVEAANIQLEASRQQNSVASMRAAVDDLQGAFRQMRAQLVTCAGLQAAADPHAGHAMPNMLPIRPAAAAAPAAPKGAAPMDHAAMGHGAPAAKPAAPRGAKPAPAAPMDHSKMPMGSAPARKPQAGAGAKPAAPAGSMDHSKMPMGKRRSQSGRRSRPGDQTGEPESAGDGRRACRRPGLS